MEIAERQLPSPLYANKEHTALHIFNQSKYTKWYYNIINNSSAHISGRYTEYHHIIPKCMGGTNEQSNLIRLTAREHFICHLLLTKMTEQYKDKMVFAFWRMMYGGKNQQRHIASSHQYKFAKEEMSKAISEQNKSQIPWNKGKKVGNIPWNKGKTGVMSESARRKISEARKGQRRIISEETKTKISQSIKNRLHSEETKQKLKTAAKNRKRRLLTEDQRKNLSLAMKASWKRRKEDGRTPRI